MRSIAQPLAVALSVLAITLAAGCSGGSSENASESAVKETAGVSTPSAVKSTSKPSDTGSDKPAETTTPDPEPVTKPAPPKADQTRTTPKDPVAYALMKTSLGDIVLELNQEKAPISVENFLRYADGRFYHGTIFHRVISTFMIQGGGFTPDMTKKPTEDPIKNEWQNGLKNVRGSVAMARLGGRPDSATSQFFVNVVDNSRLDRPQPDGAAYAVFGRVIAGMDVVDAIRVIPTGVRARMQDVPQETVEILEVRQITADQAKTRAAAAG